MGDNDQKPESPKQDLGFVDDVARLGITIGRLFRYWTLPMDAAPIHSLTKPEKESFRIASLAVIVFLFLTLRPDLEQGLATAVFGIAVAAGVAFLSNALLAYNVHVSDDLVIGSYSFLACTLLIYILFSGAVSDEFMLENSIFGAERICGYFEGGTDGDDTCDSFISFRTALLTFVFTSVGLLAKSIFLDKNALGFRVAARGMLTIFIFTLTCVFLDLVPEEIFRVIYTSFTNVES